MTHHQSTFGRLRSIAIASGLVFATMTALVSTDASAAAKAGQICAAAKVGTKDGALTCTKDGSRFRWTGPGGASATTAAPTTTAPRTTKAVKIPKETTTKAG